MTLRLSDVGVSAGDRVLVDVPDLRVTTGRATVIVGESGSGKSLLAHAAMGTLAAELAPRGRMDLAGDRFDLADRGGRRALWGRTLALLPQEPVLALDPTMRIREQVAEGVARWARDRRGARDRAEELLGQLGLRAWGRAFPHTLSGGMAQRTAFAAATAGGAAVLIADEPSKGLDARARDSLARLLRGFVESGGLLLVITHDLDLARLLGGDVCVMKDAGVVEQGPVETVLSTPSHPYTRRLLAAEPRRWAHPWMRARPVPDGSALITAEGITKGFDGRTLFSDLSMSVCADERIALTGPSGSGKTTLGNVLLRLANPDAGRVRHADALSRGRVQKLYQDPALAFPPRVALRAVMRDVCRRHRVAAGRVEELAERLRLDPALMDRRPDQVSGGELQRLAIIRAMLLQPAALFADEPTSRLDLISQEETICALMAQVDRQGCALVLVTHDRDLAGAVADHEVPLGLQASAAPST